MTVKQLMTTPVKTCRANALVGEAARMMLEENCGCLPVTDAKGHLAGILTDRDICLAVARHLDPTKTPVRDVMTVRVVSCGVEDYLDRALVEMKEKTCCGFGGTFSVKFPEISGGMARTKIDSIVRTGAKTVVSADSSCLMQIQGALSRAALPVRTMHLAEVLASR